MLLICPVRPGDSNQELRYALRSWEQNLILGGMSLCTVGYKPAWLNPDIHLDGNRFTSVPFAVFDNIRYASEVLSKNSDLANKPALYMNDDFFCLDPVGSVLPVRRNCTLEQHVATFGSQNNGLWWPRSLALTLSWLRSEGYPHPESYEVHRPLLASPAAMYEALSRWDITSGDDVPQWRTVYGVLNEVEAYPVQDVKLSGRVTGMGTPWVSTSDQTWRRYVQAFTKRFQKPSRWELG